MKIQATGSSRWLSWSNFLQFRSWYCGPWVQAPVWAMSLQLRAWTLLQILCVCLSLHLHCSLSVSVPVSVSVSLSQKYINKKENMGRLGWLSWISVWLLVWAQVMFSWFVGLSAASGSMQSVWSLPWILYLSPSLSGPPLLVLSQNIELYF